MMMIDARSRGSSSPPSSSSSISSSISVVSLMTQRYSGPANYGARPGSKLGLLNGGKDGLRRRGRLIELLLPRLVIRDCVCDEGRMFDRLDHGPVDDVNGEAQ